MNKFSLKFSETFQSRWIRFEADKNCDATALLVYKKPLYGMLFQILFINFALKKPI